MADVQIDIGALHSELRNIINQQGRQFMQPAAMAVKQEALRIAKLNFKVHGPGVHSIHYEYFSHNTGILPEYRISYDGQKRSYMGLWEIGTRRFGPRPYLRPAAEIVSKLP